MNMLGWRIGRLAYVLRRVRGSLALRGWRGTFRRIVQEHERMKSAAACTRDPGLLTAAKRAGSRRILIVDSMAPDPTRDSGSVRLTQIMGLLQEEGWEIFFFADDDLAVEADVTRLAALGVELRRDAITPWLRSHGASLDAVMLCRLAVADQYLTLVRGLAPGARVVFDTVDLHHIREQRAAELIGKRQLIRQASKSRARELDIIQRSDVTLVVSDHEAATLAETLPASKVRLLSNIHDVHARERDFAQRDGLLFIGGFGHPPNADAVRWFIKDILPIVWQSEPSLIFHVVGDIDPASRLELSTPGVAIHGRVADIEPLLAQCRVSVAPLRFGAGVKGKVNLSLSYGLPAVVTTVAAEGMHLVHGVNAMIADAAPAFAVGLLELYKDEATWERLSVAGQRTIREYFSREHARQALRDALIPPEPAPLAN